MRFIILCKSSPELSYSAYHLAKAILANKHNLAVFFLKDAVFLAAENWPDLVQAQTHWLALKNEGLDLKVCQLSATKRNLKSNSLVSGFELSSSSALIMALAESDRVLCL